MNIVICGLGKFGSALANDLSIEKHNVVVIDNKASVVESIVNEYDVKGYVGNCASYQTLKEVIDNKTDLVISCTSSDEINFLCSLVSHKLGAKHIIVRTTNPEYELLGEKLSKEFGLSMAINSDKATARDIFRSIKYPSALNVETFTNGKVDLVEIDIDENSLLKGKSLIEIKEEYQLNVLVCAVSRNDEVFIPKGDFVINENDTIYMSSSTRELDNAFKKLKLARNKAKQVMIIGGSKIAYYLAKMLIDDGIDVKIIDRDEKICESLSELLPEALIIHGEGTKQNILEEEGLSEVDTLVTLTGFDETNMIISNQAKSVGVEKIITKVNGNYNQILENLGLNIVVSPKEIFTSNIIRFIRGMESNRCNEFKTLYRLVDNKVEALEFSIQDKTKYTSIPLKDLKMKDNFLIAAIIRSNKVIVPNGNDTIEPLDTVIFVTTEKNIIDVGEIFE